MKSFKEIEAENRKKRNKELTDLVKAGAEISPTMPLSALFFPPRPLIKKDKKSLEQLFGKKEEENK